MRLSLVLLATLLLAPAALGQALPACPGAEGPGATATGGRAGDLYHVTNLEFDLNGVIPGSLKYGINTAPAAGRTIVFDVGGTIHQNGGGANWWFRSGKSNITVAGQTAPGPGITIAGVGSKWTGDNVILRNVTVRPNQDPINPTSFTYDAFSLQLKNSIVDHVTASWHTDEGVSLTDAGENSSVQYALINEGLNYNGHSYGSIISTEFDGTKYAFHHNLYAHNNSRVPRLGSELGAVGAVTNFSNNVIYNWLSRAGYSGTDQPSSTNFLGNYYVKGNNNGATVFTGGDNAGNLVTKIYHSGNVYDSNKNGVADGVAVTNSNFAGSKLLVSTAFDVATTGVVETAAAARQRVLDYGGANWASRNPIDERVVQGVRDGTGAIINDLSGATQAAEWATVLAQRPTGGAAPFTRPADWDVDGDGMPGFWETRHGLDPVAAAPSADFDADGYTDLEEYLNEVSAWPAPGVIAFKNDLGDSRFARIQNWEVSGQQVNVAGQGLVIPTTYWQPSRFDTAAITSGSVVVDAVGQQVGVLRVAPDAGQTATLNVTAGWLEAPGGIEIATAGASGQVNLSGGALRVGALTKGAGGSFNFTGGELDAEQVGFDLVNSGGALSPGDSIGTTMVTGSVTLSAGSLAIDLTSPTENDLLTVTGVLSLGGALEVSLLDGFAPTSGSWVIATAGSFAGTFTSVTQGYSVSQQGTDLVLSVAARLPGDYSGDGAVDAADYTVWRDGGSPDSSQAGYDLWAANYGSSNSASANAVPEPAAARMAALAMLMARWIAGTRGRNAAEGVPY